MKKWRRLHPEKAKASRDRWEAAHREERLASRRANARAARLRDPKRHKLKNKEWREKNRDYVQSKFKEWTARNYDRWRASIRAWNERNPDKLHEYRARRRAKMAGAYKIEKVLRTEALRRHRGLCVVCGRAVDPKRFVVDHVVPLAKGGQHVVENLAPAHPLCNAIKKDRPLEVAKRAVREHLL